ncbi:ammonium transporter [Paenibacillus antibioticophila]|uniref:ammonium transporter n=1 Tax=Paenibacillus antibioticophila TaxID=1274374 RepID=UPI0005CA7AED|nr:ammonium transporter [Paenibacillus antibioticophila]
MKAHQDSMFNFQQLNYKMLIAASMLLFAVIVYIDRSSVNDNLVIVQSGYWTSFGLATIWGIINYISHIQYNVTSAILHGDIEEYVDKMKLSIEEAQELKTYLADYASDLVIQHHLSEKDARTRAMNEFNIKEIHQLMKDKNLFIFMKHTYLLGYAAVFTALFLLLSVISSYVGWSTTMVSIISMLIIYTFGFIGMFILYKFLDAIFRKKLYGDEE